jgi:glyoxylase-like metal-dependent hydrolase (beta-lactamase superfamily II)
LLIHADDAKLVTNPSLMTRYGLFFEIEPTKPGAFLKEGDQFQIAHLKFEILHCPGHCPGSIVLYERAAGVAFVGDVIFAGSVGRTDLPGGSWDQLLESIDTKILTLPDDTKLLPGHGPVTTVGQERRTNPFLR